MHLLTRNQHTAIAAATLFAHASATTVLVLAPARFVLDLGHGPAAYGALAGVAAAVAALATPIGRYLSSHAPGRLVIVVPASLAAALAPVVLAFCTALAPVAGSLVLGVAALATVRPAWQSLVRASTATDAARWAARAGLLSGVGVALAASSRPGGLLPGIRIGACLGLLGLLVLVVSVQDSRAPLAPRRSVTLSRAQRALGVAQVRAAAALGAAGTAANAGGTIALLAAPGPGPDPTAVMSAVVLGWFCHTCVQHAFAARAASAVTHELQLSARAAVETAALLGAATGALLAAGCVRIVG